MMGKGGLERKSKASSEIPSSSLADMAFLLLIFFMVSTVFPKEQPREVTFPDAEQTQKVEEPRRNVVHVYVEQDGQIYINDMTIRPEDVSAIIQPLYEDNPELIVSLRGDINVPYRYIGAVQQELQEARAVRVTFHTSLERQIQRTRR